MNPMTTEWMEARISALEAEGMTRSDAQAVVEAEMLEAQRSMEWTLIHSYTRKQAIEDGVLVDVSAAAFGVGFKVHVAMTATAYAATHEAGLAHKSEGERLFAFLRTLKQEIRDQSERFGASLGNEFQWVYLNRIRLKARMGPGDSLEAVLTLMLPHED